MKQYGYNNYLQRGQYSRPKGQKVCYYMYINSSQTTTTKDRKQIGRLRTT